MTNGATVSCWLSELAFHQSYPPLNQDLTCDVCIIGAGIAGASVAYMLAREGKRVVIIDKNQPGDGETGRTTAHLASALDDGFVELEKMFGTDGARLAASSHAAAIDRIESIIADEGINCDFQRLYGYLFNPPDADVQNLHRELEAARRAGLAVEMLPRAPLEYDTGPCLQFARQGQFHPMKYLSGLLAAIQRRGGQIFGQTAAGDITGGRGHPCKLTTSTGKTITAESIVVATNTPINDRVVMHTKQAAYRSYAIALRIPQGSVSPGLYWDTADPYHYVRLQSWGEKTDLLIAGGEDHKTGQPPTHPDAPFTKLEKWTRRLFPDSTAIVQRWSGQVLEPVDGLAFIGHNPMDDQRIYIATGDSGHGMTHGTIAGILITDLIAGRPNPWTDLYSPRRRTARSADTYVSENLNVVRQYADWLSPSDVDDESEVPRGSGLIQRRGAKRVALYRDEDGTLHRLSAVCPHLYGIVHWNAVEKTWDCPCHGSRFSATGNVLCGPAISDLTPIDEPQPSQPPANEASFDQGNFPPY